MAKLVTCFALFVCYLTTGLVAGEDSSPAEPVQDASAEVEPAQDAGSEAEGGDPVDYEAQSKELLEKMAQLKKLLKAKGDTVGDEQMEKFKNLEKMLGSLTGGGPKTQDKEVTEFFATCVILAMQRAGQTRKSTRDDMRKMGEGKMTAEVASKSELWLMATSCITRITDDELAKFKAGTLRILPKEHTEAAKTPEMKAEVLKLESGHWDMFEEVAKDFAKSWAEEPHEAPASGLYGMIAAVPLLGIFGLLAKKMMDMNSEKDKRREEKEKKKEKKSK